MKKLEELSSSSLSESKHCGKCVEDIVKSFERTSIRSCVVGVSSIFIENSKITHTALFLTDKDVKKLEKKEGDNEEGIIIEYGKYIPKRNEEEMKGVKNGYVVYRYGVENGGLRYYINTLKVFKESFGNIAYMILEVNKDNQISFSYLLDKIAPKYENKWIHEKYVLKGILKDTFNCRTFTAHALNIIEPIYDSRLIQKGKKYINKDRNPESLIPEEVLDILKEYKN